MAYLPAVSRRWTGTRSTCYTQKSRTLDASRLTLSPAGYYRVGTDSLNANFSDPLFATVLEWGHCERAEVEVELCEERGRRGAECTAVAVGGLECDTDSVTCGTKQPLGAALRDPARAEPRG